MMRTILTFCCVMMIGLTLTPDVAEAKRFGGGSSFGKLFSTPKKAPQAAPAPAPQTLGKTAAATPTRAKPGMGGMLGGLLAGGLLGALLFGGAFEGIQLMDILILGLIAVLAYKLFARSRSAHSHPQYAAATAAGPMAEPAPPRTCAPTPFMSSGLGDDEPELPAGFDKEAFLEGAREHFAELQRAWSHNDLATIRSYCAPALFASLEEERRRLGAGMLDNDLVSVMAEVMGYREEAREAQLSVNFYGWMREGAGAQTTEFNEIWHLTRDLATPGADWFIVGIEQA